MRRRFTEQGFALTLLCWITAVLFSPGMMMGDCIPDNGRRCPTDHQRDMSLVKVILGAAAVNVGGLFLLGYRYTREHRD
jgi:hypothetical protein